MRYRAGGKSGTGSLGKLARFKAELVNSFVAERGITSVIEFGCGDGHQLGMMRLPRYVGFDVSPSAIEGCRELFSNDLDKTFAVTEEYDGECAQLALSIDVIYHLVEDDVYSEYMTRLFSAAERYVVIYSTNTDSRTSLQSNHVRHREFESWVAENIPGWRLVEKVTNPYSRSWFGLSRTIPDFYLFEKT